MKRDKIPLDTYDIIPEEQRIYLMNYGKHFNEKMCKFAVSLMRDKEGKKMPYIKKDDILTKLKENGVELENDVMYDSTFVYHMGASDVMGSSVPDEKHLCLYVKDLIDDDDQADGYLFARFYSDCVNKGMPIDWAEML